MEHLSATLKKGGIKDLSAFFPPSKRDNKNLEEHFKKEGLQQVADWWTKKQYAAIKDSIIKELAELMEREEGDDVVSFQFIYPVLAWIINTFVTDGLVHQVTSRIVSPSRK